MATIEKRRGGYRLVFWYQSKRFQGAVKARSDRDAAQIKGRVERNLQLLQEGRLAYDAERDDLFTLMLSDGKLNAKPEAARRITLAEFFDNYEAERPPDKETSTAYTERIHVRHLRRLLGDKTPLADVPVKLQFYVNERSGEKTRKGEPVRQVTIKKELGTLSSVWNGWAFGKGLVSVALSLRQLRYPKGDEKPPFQTWEQIERRIARGKLNAEEQAKLWDGLFLTVPEIELLLEHVRQVKYRWKNSSFPWVFPMFAFAAYTGARRSEILRCRLEDLDFEGGITAIREKKKDRSKKETLRHVPLMPRLREGLQQWLKIHPGGPLTFCKSPDEPLSQQMATHYLRWALDGSRWAVIKGWHVLRHSFISNLASQGVSERVIMALAGHLNRETTRRYAHLLPSTVNDGMRLVFGKGPLSVADPH
jgi:integrase